jgi:hypothetical protein
LALNDWSDVMVLAAIGSAAVSVAVSQVQGALTEGRSVVCEVDNNTDLALNKTGDEHSHGGFAVTPASIPPRQVMVFGSQSTGILTGTEGSVTFAANELALTVSWDNPWAGSNSCDASMSGNDVIRYQLTHTCGSGNTNAHMRYELFEFPAQSEWRFCHKCQSMFFNGYPTKGLCPGGGEHEAAGYNFVLPHDVAGTGNMQTDWRFCEKCQVMFYDGYPGKGVCPSGGEHHAAGYNFVLPEMPSDVLRRLSDQRCLSCWWWARSGRVSIRFRPFRLSFMEMRK